MRFTMSLDLQGARGEARMHDAKHRGRARADVPGAAAAGRVRKFGHLRCVQLADQGVVVRQAETEARGDEPTSGGSQNGLSPLIGETKGCEVG